MLPWSIQNVRQSFFKLLEHFDNKMSITELINVELQVLEWKNESSRNSTFFIVLILRMS